jgi:hypothetical protein
MGFWWSQGESNPRPLECHSSAARSGYCLLRSAVARRAEVLPRPGLEEQFRELSLDGVRRRIEQRLDRQGSMETRAGSRPPPDIVAQASNEDCCGCMSIVVHKRLLDMRWTPKPIKTVSV